MKHTKPIDQENEYWFYRWCLMRYEKNRYKKLLGNYSYTYILKALNENKRLSKENKQLKETLKEIRANYQPIKTKIHNGHSKRG